MDNYILTGPNGSQFNVGSYVLPDPGPDFGAKDLLKAEYTETPLAEGGVLESEAVGVRHMIFPVRLASSASFPGGLPGVEAFLASIAKPGAYVDLMPNGVATADAVRFDVLGGRYEEDYSIPQQRVVRREGVLSLDVQPYGYWPTEMILASVASIGLPGRLAITGASIVGDVPAAARLTVQPTCPTSYPLGTWVPDMLVWSFGARASMVPFIPAASIGSAIAGALVGNAFSPGSQALNLFPSPTQNTWAQIALATVASALEPAYRGCFRAFAWAQLSPSQPMPFQLSLDVVPALNPGAALASAQSIATLAPIVRGASIAAASPAFHLLDLGEISLPPVASGLQQNLLLRLWANPGGTSIGVATPQIALGGLYLLPKSGDHGVLARGLAVPMFATPSAGRFAADYVAQRAYVGAAPTDLSIQLPLTPAPFYRGCLPRVTPSMTAIDLMTGARRSDLSMNYIDEVLLDGPAVYFRMNDPVPTSMAPFAGIGPTGIYAGIPSTGRVSPLLGLGAGVKFVGPTQYARATVAQLSPSSFTAELWARMDSVASEQTLISWSPSSGQASYWTRLNRVQTTGILKSFTNEADDGVFQTPTGGVQASQIAAIGDRYHHIVLTYDGAAGVRTIYFDGAVAGTAVASALGPASSCAAITLHLAEEQRGRWYFNGNLSEVALYAKPLSAARVAAHYAAGVSPTGGVPAPLIRAGADFAAVSLTYRPRFRFLKSF